MGCHKIQKAAAIEAHRNHPCIKSTGRLDENLPAFSRMEQAL